MNHRVALFTDDLEPITVLQLTALAHQHLLEHKQVTLACIEPIDYLIPKPDEQIAIKPRTVTISAQRLTFNGKTKYMLMAMDKESALLLKAAFLPGQQSAISGVEAQGIAKGFLAALESLGPRF